MEFTLVYRGALEAKRNNMRSEKQSLRRAFHHQLKRLWEQHPLDDYRHLWDATARLYSQSFDIRKDVGGFSFAPLVGPSMRLVADLEIHMLRPDPPGKIQSQSGDIDNRLKLLLDSLRMPHHTSELPDQDGPKNGEIPFFCLLEDDSLIHNLSINSHRWLERGLGRSEVQLLIKVRTLNTRLLAFDNLGSGLV